MRERNRNLKIEINFDINARKSGTSNITAMSYRIRIKQMLINYKGKQLENFDGASDVEDGHSDGKLLVISYDDWILDSTCMFCMCPNRNWFSTYKIISNGAMIVKIMHLVR